MRKTFPDSTLFQILSAELDEINKLKWIESEREHRDIGTNKAILIWVKYHKSNWLKKYKNDR